MRRATRIVDFDVSVDQVFCNVERAYHTCCDAFGRLFQRVAPFRIFELLLILSGMDMGNVYAYVVLDCCDFLHGHISNCFARDVLWHDALSSHLMCECVEGFRGRS